MEYCHVYYEWFLHAGHYKNHVSSNKKLSSSPMRTSDLCMRFWPDGRTTSLPTNQSNPKEQNEAPLYKKKCHSRNCYMQISNQFQFLKKKCGFKECKDIGSGVILKHCSVRPSQPVWHINADSTVRVMFITQQKMSTIENAIFKVII